MDLVKFTMLCILFLGFVAIRGADSTLCSRCSVNYRTQGCWKDVKSNRSLPELLFTERDKYSNKWNHFTVDWMNWETYLPAFTCRCAKAADDMGYNYFGMQFWGECWSGPSPAADLDYKKHGIGEYCYNHKFKPCTDKFVRCVGATRYNFVYKIKHNS